MRWRRWGRRDSPRPATPFVELRLRPARPADAAQIGRLAELDGAAVPAPPLLLAEAAGELWVAVSLVSLEHVADPFRPSGEVAALALQRARQMGTAGGLRTTPGGRSPRAARHCHA